MKLSLKVEYACRVLAQLARYAGSDAWVHVDDLAKAEALPANYLVQILNELRNGGLILSKRGKQGGYALSKEPKAVSLASIIRVVDVDMLDIRVSRDGQSGPRVADVWLAITSVLEQEASKYTLEDFIPGDAGEMYYI